MKILVANLGSTSFKYRLYDLADGTEQLLSRGAVERIGSENARVKIQSPRGEVELVEPILDHGDAVQVCLDQLTDAKFGVLQSAADVAAIGFKAVHARNITGVHKVDEDVLEAMEAFADVCPAHNPPYVNAMRMLADRFPRLPLVAAFETGFHRTVPESNQRYAIPEKWTTELGVRRWGFHGASHRYIAGRMAELLGRNDLKVITCHLGGSSSLCASRGGKSVATSMGMSPQSGLPQNNRVGDLDVFALPVILRETGLSLEEVLDTLANKSGLEGVGGAGNDLRDIEAAAEAGNARASLALEMLIASARHYLGAYLVELGGADAIAFTGGIGENSVRIRTGVCRDLDWFGITLDPALQRRRACRAQGLGRRLARRGLDRPDERGTWSVGARQTRDLLLEIRAVDLIRE